jgi:hypothetical protein
MLHGVAERGAEAKIRQHQQKFVIVSNNYLLSAIII